MNRNEILKFLNENPSCVLATVEGNRPRVRGMWIYRAEPDGILFHTGKTKAVWRQIERNPAVELCFYSPEKGTQVRVCGTAREVLDADLLEEIMTARPFLREVAKAVGPDSIKVFRVTECSAAVWTMETNLDPTTWMRL